MHVCILGDLLFTYENVFIDNIWFIYGILISNIFQKYTQDFCRGINQMSVFSFTGIVQTITTAFLSFLLIPTQGVYGFVLATIGANIVTALFTFFILIPISICLLMIGIRKL